MNENNENSTDKKINNETNNTNIDEKKYRYYCDICNIGARTNTEWFRHVESKKHLRGGLKPKTCNICNTDFYNHWNLKQHYIMVHATPEEKEKCKYYCKLCNVVYLSELYFNNHNKGVRHNNNVKSLEILETIKKDFDKKCQPINLEILEAYSNKSKINDLEKIIIKEKSSKSKRKNNKNLLIDNDDNIQL